VNLLKNHIGVEQARALVIILKEHSALKSLCGSNGNETELDMSGKMNGAEDAIMPVAEIIGNGALTRLDISKNKLFHNDGAPAGKAISGMLAANSTLRELDVSGSGQYDFSKGGPSFAQALSVGISDNGALTSLNLSSNYLEVEGAKIIAEAVKVN
jgi:hypothetical protein